MKKLCVFLILCLLVLIVPSLAPASSVMGMEGIREQAPLEMAFRLPWPKMQHPLGLTGAAQNASDGYWQLVQTIEEPGDSSFNASYHGELCSTHTVSWSNGLVSDSVYWPKTTSPDYYSYCENTRSMTFSGSASWTPPPQVINPGDELYLNGHVTIHDRDSRWPAGVSWAVGYDTTHVCTVNPNEGTKYCENQTFIVREGQTGAQFKIGVTVTVTWRTVYPDGDSMNSIGRYTYVYEWVEEGTETVAPPAQQDPQSGLTDAPSSPQHESPSLIIDSPSSSSSSSWWLPFGVIGILGGLGILGVLGIGGLAILIAISRGWGKSPLKNTRIEPINPRESEATIGAPVDTTEWGIFEPGFEKEWIRSQIASEIEKLKKDGYFIGNTSEFRKVWNLTFGQVTNRIRGWKKNMYCEEMVVWGNDHLSRILPEGSYVTQIKLERNRAYNHIANKVILPDGTEFVVDYWQSLADGKPAIYSVEEWLGKWEKALGKPSRGDWNIRDEIDGAQASLIDQVLRKGEDSIDDWRYRGKNENYEDFNTIRQWWKSLDIEVKTRLKTDYHKRFPEHEKEILNKQMHHGRVIRQR